MFDKQSQAAKALQFRLQHQGNRLLILPNIWDALGARLMEKLGYPSVATASVATAIANGYHDGEHIPFDRLLEIVQSISSSVDIPVTVDIERGFAADNLKHLKENIRLLIEHGAVGINIEDSRPDHKSLNSIKEQCRKIESIREVSEQTGVSLVINARTDVFLLDPGTNALADGIERGRAYKDAGADCVYPVTIGTYEAVAQFVVGVAMPVNVLLMKSIPDLKQLKAIGVARVSLGPNLLTQVLGTMKEIAEGLLVEDSSAFFGREFVSREFRDSLV
jgi:2-methylisocitrate lyase-like PEP mutase family enzyme